MNVKEVVKLAISYVGEVFSAEKPTNLGLEAVSYNEESAMWNVTVGFSRPWDYEATVGQSLVMRAMQQPVKKPTRQYKIVLVSDVEAKVKAIRMRE